MPCNVLCITMLWTCVQVWLDDQVLACAQVDLIGAIFDAELALSAAQVIARRDAKAGKQSHMVATSPAARAALAKPEVCRA
jgi:hypothetical protein